MLYAARRINLSHLKENEKGLLKRLCTLSKSIYNEALKNIETHYASTGKFLFWIENANHIKKGLQEYKEIGSCYQAIIREADSNFRTYKTAASERSRYHRRWEIYDHWEKAAPPSPKKDYFSLICENFVQRGGCLRIPLSNELSKTYKPLYISLPPNLREVRIVRFVIRPQFDFNEYEILVSYEVREQPQELDKSRCLAIDLGVENLATCADDRGKSFIIDGRYLKSIIQGFEKQMAQIRSIKHKQNLRGYTNREKALLKSRQNRIEDYLNKSVKYIIDYCIHERIGNIVVGYGYNFSVSPNLGHQNNQIFAKIPYYKLFEKLRFQCAKFGIQFAKQNECYTSKASFYDNDPLPENINGKKWQFSGKRKHRGLYISKDGRKMNADLNGALNIMRKSNLVSLEKIKFLQSRGVAEPVRIRVLNQTSHKIGKTLKPQKP